MNDIYIDPEDVLLEFDLEPEEPEAPDPEAQRAPTKEMSRELLEALLERASEFPPGEVTK